MRRSRSSRDAVQVGEVPEVLPPADPVVEPALAAEHEPHARTEPSVSSTTSWPEDTTPSPRWAGGASRGSS